jgi:hypothetical protein
MGYGFIELSTISPSKVGQSKNFTKKTVNGLIDTNASVSCGHNIAMHAVKSKLNNDHSLLASKFQLGRSKRVLGVWGWDSRGLYFLGGRGLTESGIIYQKEMLLFSTKTYSFNLFGYRFERFEF